MILDIKELEKSLLESGYTTEEILWMIDPDNKEEAIQKIISVTKRKLSVNQNKGWNPILESIGKPSRNSDVKKCENYFLPDFSEVTHFEYALISFPKNNTLSRALAYARIKGWELSNSREGESFYNDIKDDILTESFYITCTKEVEVRDINSVFVICKDPLCARPHVIDVYTLNLIGKEKVSYLFRIND
jgi:hypothetical protein